MKQISYLAFALMILSTVACHRSKTDYDASGTFEATEVIVSAEVTGRLIDFSITEGDAVTAGAQVGIVDTVQLYLKKMQLENSVRATGSRRADISLQIAATREQITTQQREKTRFEELVKNNAANQKQVDDITSQIAVLERQLAAQTSTLERNNTGVTAESSALEIQVAQVADQLRRSYILSPIAGTILAKYAEQGELATPGKPLFKVADVDHLFLRAYVTSDQLSNLKIGQAATVYADFGKDNRREYTGRIAWIADQAEFTPKGILTADERANQVYAVKIAIANDGYAKIGMYGEVIFNK